jgi:hypothetical protein
MLQAEAMCAACRMQLCSTAAPPKRTLLTFEIVLSQLPHCGLHRPMPHVPLLRRWHRCDWRTTRSRAA